MKVIDPQVKLECDPKSGLNYPLKHFGAGDVSGQMKSRPHTTDFHPKGSVLEGKFPAISRKSRLVKSMSFGQMFAIK